MNSNIKPSSYKLSPNEAERQIKEENEKRRKIRLKQVREQSKEISYSIRNRIKKEHEKQFQIMKHQLKKKLQEDKENKISDLETQLERCFRDIGSSHMLAQQKEEILQESQKHPIENWKLSNERGKKAKIWLDKETEARREAKEFKIQAKNHADAVEKVRASKIAALPLPKSCEQKTKELESLAADIKKIHLQQQNGIRVERVDPSAQENARDAARKKIEEDTMKENEKKKLEEQQQEVASRRHQEALKKEASAKEHTETIVELKQADKDERNHRTEQQFESPEHDFSVQSEDNPRNFKFDDAKSPQKIVRALYEKENDISDDSFVQKTNDATRRKSCDSDVTLNDAIVMEASSSNDASPLVDREMLSSQLIPKRPVLSKLLDDFKQEHKYWIYRKEKIVEDKSHLRLRKNENGSKVNAVFFPPPSDETSEELLADVPVTEEKLSSRTKEDVKKSETVGSVDKIITASVETQTDNFKIDKEEMICVETVGQRLSESSVKDISEVNRRDELIEKSDLTPVEPSCDEDFEFRKTENGSDIKVYSESLQDLAGDECRGSLVNDFLKAQSHLGIREAILPSSEAGKISAVKSVVTKEILPRSLFPSIFLTPRSKTESVSSFKSRGTTLSSVSESNDSASGVSYGSGNLRDVLKENRRLADKMFRQTRGLIDVENIRDQNEPFNHQSIPELRWNNDEAGSLPVEFDVICREHENQLKQLDYIERKKNELEMLTGSRIKTVFSTSRSLCTEPSASNDLIGCYKRHPPPTLLTRDLNYLESKSIAIDAHELSTIQESPDQSYNRVHVSPRYFSSFSSTGRAQSSSGDEAIEYNNVQISVASGHSENPKKEIPIVTSEDHSKMSSDSFLTTSVDLPSHGDIEKYSSAGVNPRNDVSVASSVGWNQELVRTVANKLYGRGNKTSFEKLEASMTPSSTSESVSNCEESNHVISVVSSTFKGVESSVVDKNNFCPTLRFPSSKDHSDIVIVTSSVNLPTATEVTTDRSHTFKPMLLDSSSDLSSAMTPVMGKTANSTSSRSLHSSNLIGSDLTLHAEATNSVTVRENVDPNHRLVLPPSVEICESANQIALPSSLRQIHIDRLTRCEEDLPQTPTKTSPERGQRSSVRSQSTPKKRQSQATADQRGITDEPDLTFADSEISSVISSTMSTPRKYQYDDVFITSVDVQLLPSDDTTVIERPRYDEAVASSYLHLWSGGSSNYSSTADHPPSPDCSKRSVPYISDSNDETLTNFDQENTILDNAMLDIDADSTLSNKDKDLSDGFTVKDTLKLDNRIKYVDTDGSNIVKFERIAIRNDDEKITSSIGVAETSKEDVVATVINYNLSESLLSFQCHELSANCNSFHDATDGRKHVDSSKNYSQRLNIHKERIFSEIGYSDGYVSSGSSRSSTLKSSLKSTNGQVTSDEGSKSSLKVTFKLSPNVLGIKKIRDIDVDSSSEDNRRKRVTKDVKMSSDRKKDEINYKRRTKRLWNNLEEVTRKNEEQNRKVIHAVNREKAKKFHQATLERIKKQTKRL